MPLIQGSNITTEAILERFKAVVVDNILKDAYHAGNPPMFKGHQCVPISEMDHLDNLDTVPYVGEDGEIVNAETVLNGLIDVTRKLTCVGSFVFTLWLKHTQDTAGYLNDPAIQAAMADAQQKIKKANSYPQSIHMINQAALYKEREAAIAAARSAQQRVDQMIREWCQEHKDDQSGETWQTEIPAEDGQPIGGKCIFNQSRIRGGFGAPSDVCGVEYGNIIVAENLNNLMANIYSQWANTPREEYQGSAVICHASCHFNCHSNCHFNCHSACHGWTIIKNA